MSEPAPNVSVIHDLITNGRTKVAEGMLKKALADYPEDTQLKFELGRLLLFGKKDLPESERIFRELLIADPDSTPHLIHLYLALNYSRQIEEAEASIEKLYQRTLDPQRAVIMAMHADFKCWAEVPNFKKYLPDVEEAYQLEPNNPLIAQIMAHFLANLPETLWKNGGEKRAFDFIEGWIQNHPEDLHMLYRLATLQQFMGKLNTANKLYQDVILQNPDNEIYVQTYEANKKIIDFWEANAKNYPPYVKKQIIKD